MKKLIYLTFLLGTLVTMNFVSCTYDQIVPEDEIIPDDPTQVDTVYFSTDIIPIFNASCNNSACHDADGPPPNLVATEAYNALIDGGYIDLVTPADSELYQWMKGNRSIPMPTSGPNSSYNAKVLNWIKQGALNN